MYKNAFVIKYKEKYVGGYSLKQNKVWFVPQVEQAKVFNSIQVNRFISNHANKGQGFYSDFITVQVKKEENNHTK